jgi:ADP-heptose:LPS heptosyltransferase
LKLSTKILIDTYAGLPLVYLLNIVARILGFFLRIDHSLDRQVKTIAVCKFVGMGSIIQSGPLLKTLRKKYPSAKIIFVTNVSNLSLFHFIDEVDEVYAISDKGFLSLVGSNIRLLLKLWKNRPDVYIDLEIYSNYSSMITTMSLARNRMGFFKDDKTYRKGMYTHMMFYNIKSPVSQTYLQFSRLLGCRDVITEVSINALKIHPDAMASIKQKLNISDLGKYILINPNASDLRLERRWPAMNIIRLITILSAEFPHLKIILIGSEAEASYVKNIYSGAGETDSLFDSSGKLSLPELIALIANSELLITNDTGPMHLAFSLKTRTVALFGPCSPQQYGGMGRSISVYKNVYCSPCVHEFMIPPCKGDNQCMKKITVDEVHGAVKKALLNLFSEIDAQQLDYINSDAAPLGVVLR